MVLHGEATRVLQSTCLVLIVFLVARCGCECRSVGPEAEECKRLIEAHKACLRKEGFKV